MSILVFNTLKEATDCEAQISALGRELYRTEGYKIVSNEVEIKPNKQRIVKWADVTKGFNVEKYYFASPQHRYPEYYDQLINGFAPEVLKNIPSEWINETI